MFRVNKKLEYGVLALLYLATKARSVASVREISADCRVPVALLSKVMQLMKNAGFVVSVHGNHGGYALHRQLSQINLLELTEVLVGPIQVAECLAPGKVACPAQESCTIVTPMTMLNKRILDLFQQTSLELLSNRKVAT